MAEHMTPVVAKVLPEEKAAFAAATQLVGTTPSNAIRMFIAAAAPSRSTFRPTGPLALRPILVNNDRPKLPALGDVPFLPAVKERP